MIEVFAGLLAIFTFLAYLGAIRWLVSLGVQS